MLGVGWTEMLVIGVVALIVIGPKELPAVMHRIGKFAGTIRRMGSEFQRELNKTTGLNEIANLRNSVTAPLKATADAIRKEFNTTTATGEVKPSGALKPADPKVESVVDEIKAAAGIAAPAVVAAPVMPPTKASAASAKGAASTAAKAPVKAARPPKVKLPAESKVVAADIAPAKKPVAKAKEPATPVASIETKATAQAKKPVAKKATAVAPTAKVAATAAEPVAKPAPKAKKPAAKKA